MTLEWGTIVRNLNWTLLFNLAIFALLVCLLKRFLFKPVTAWLDQRREIEERRLSAAEKAQAQAEELRMEREAALAAANRRAREIVAQAEAEAQQVVQTARREARAQAQAILAEAEAAAARVRQEALVALRSSYAELVVLGAAQVLAREVRAADHERLLAELTSRVDARLLQ